MNYILKETQINWNQENKEELKKFIKSENFGALIFKAELNYAGIAVTEVNVEIRRMHKNRGICKAGIVETNVGITLPKGRVKGLRTAYKSLNGNIKEVECYKLKEVDN